MSKLSNIFRLITPIGAILALVMGAVPVHAAKPFRGPVEASVIRVIDGDTIVAEAVVWPGQSVRVNVRIRGIDAPEIKSRCDSEHLAAIRAREALTAMIDGGPVSISNIGGGKYYGRVLADVAANDGTAVAANLLSRKLVRPYLGGRRHSWCN